jgi:hypothetical protein
MPSKSLWICAGIGLVIVAALIQGGLFLSRDSHVELVGAIQKVRTGKLDEQRSVVVTDFRVTNPSAYPFQIKDVELELTSGGKVISGRFIPETDAKNLFLGVPELGEKYNPSFRIKEQVGKKETVDRMLAFAVDAPLGVVEARTNLVVRMREVDGPVSQLAEQR